MSVRRPDFVFINKEIDFVSPVVHIMKIEESKKKDEFLDIARDMKRNGCE